MTHFPDQSWTPFRSVDSSFAVLMYHIVDDAVHDSIAVSAATFEDHMRALRSNHCSVLSMQEAIKIAKRDEAAPARAVVVTFDDGYADNIHTALPILRRYDIPATLFVPTAYIGQTNRWNPKVTFDTRHADWEELRSWVADGLDIGGHAHDHTHLERVHGDELRTSIRVNKESLERELGITLRAFAYPYGDFTSEARSAIASRYEIAFSVDSGTWTPWADRYTINRIGVWPNCTVSELLDEIELALFMAEV